VSSGKTFQHGFKNLPSVLHARRRRPSLCSGSRIQAGRRPTEVAVLRPYKVCAQGSRHIC